VRENIKGCIGFGVSTIAPQCKYDRLLVVVAHMRCGSTALSNILCTRSDVSGYGEVHVSYDGRPALGKLLVNQSLRKSWKPNATYLFDKILHSEHDRQVCGEFYKSRAIFVAREPIPTVNSIRRLFASIGSSQYDTDQKAASYYIERVSRLVDLWRNFPSENRVGLTHLEIVRDPDKALEKITNTLKFTPALENYYDSKAASVSTGAGDPLQSASHSKIEVQRSTSIERNLSISNQLLNKAEDAYNRYVSIIRAC